jgi:uncharacterized membrane protein
MRRDDNGVMQFTREVVSIVLSVMFIGMGALHFVPAIARGMGAMIPPRMRFVSARYLVWFTDLCEIAGGIGLLVPALRVAAAIALIVFLVAVFSANAYAAKDPEKFGRAAIPFWPRLLAQLALIGLLVFVAL